MKVRFFLFLVFCQFNFQSFSQSISGSVKSSSTLTSLVDVNIVNERTGKHTHTNELGQFQLSTVEVGDQLRISHIGYIQKIVKIEETDEQLEIFLEPTDISLNEVVIAPRVDALNMITEVDVEKTPVNSSQDILRKVPGIIIGQHAGGGKAEQIFLRGFDIDHGTDLRIDVDGMPVNMVSHAHGQGYADLHFIIPELIDDIEYGKGPYAFDEGNFATAGAIDFHTKDYFERNKIKLEIGQFNSSRILGMVNLVNQSNNKAIIASEYLLSDGPFNSPQNFKRINLFGKYNSTLNNSDEIEMSFSHFTSNWDHSGQIPARAVESGMIDRFGSIDDTEGGVTSRTNVILDYHKHIDDQSTISSKAYYSRYGFELFSNFTFFLEDPVNGDQIRQTEIRDLYGINTEFTRKFISKQYSGDFSIGVELRNDESKDNELAWTVNRSETREQIQYGDIDETGKGLYSNANFDIGKLTINPAFRFDYFDFQYRDKLSNSYAKTSVRKSALSPKLNFLYNQNSKLQYYLKMGKGFHTNDSRVVIEQTVDEILPAAYGTDLGFIWKPNPNFILNTAGWYLFSEQEFVYVGDAGIVEPSGKSERKGVELSGRFQPLDWLYISSDITYTSARAIDEPEGENFIPLAPDWTYTGGVSIDLENGLYSGLNVRHISDRPASEDNSVVADGYTVVDLNANYNWRDFDIGFQIQNLLNVEWNETQFNTESRLQNEIAPVEEIHFTPGTPFFIKGMIGYQF